MAKVSGPRFTSSETTKLSATRIEFVKEKFTTNNTLSTERMFSGCNELASFDLSGFVND